MSLFGQGQAQGQNFLLAQVEAAYQRRLSGQGAGLVRGRHLIDWVPTVRQLLAEGKEDEALELLIEMAEAAGQLAKVDGVAPPATYTRQVVTIYQRRGDADGELAALDRYAAACPPGTGDPTLLERGELLRGELPRRAGDSDDAAAG